jgi:5-methylcytosine-specific restriction endonuclease McrA
MACINCHTEIERPKGKPGRKPLYCPSCRTERMRAQNRAWQRRFYGTPKWRAAQVVKAVKRRPGGACYRKHSDGGPWTPARQRYQSGWRKSPKGLAYQRAFTNRARARRAAALVCPLRPAHIRLLYVLQGGACFYCGRESRLTMDHIIPLARGGTDEPANCVLACGSCNSSKNAKLPLDWALRKRHSFMAVGSSNRLKSPPASMPADLP